MTSPAPAPENAAPDSVAPDSAAPENRADALPKSWNPADIESDVYRSWDEGGYFRADAQSDKPSYSIVLPPPNVTGSLHMGHALDHTLMDILCRRRRMQGYEVLWLPGMDHAGIATQSIVARQLVEEGTSKEEIGRDAFIERVWQWKRQSGGQISGQMRRIGDSVDWSRERFTMDDGLSRAVTTVFKMLYEAGLIYRAERLVNWSPVLRTAISDIEVKYADVEGELVSLRYGSLSDDEPHVIVATTRVETMLGDTAIAVHPDDERYAALVGTSLDHPFVDRKIPVVADSYVDPEFGTGAVKITPAHDPNDFELGLRHDLAMPTIMDESGRITATGTQFDGLDRFDARVKVREALAEQGRIVKEIRPYVHSVGHSERSGEPIEPRLSLQWWVKVDSIAQSAGDAVRSGVTTIHPASQEPRWFGWVDDMHDWCISRQLWWGHRIPIWYGPDGEIACVGPDDSPPEGWEQDPDVLDTWFSSGLWPLSTMGWPDQTPDLEKFYPTDVLVTGYDILFFWVARMMMFGTFIASESSERALPPVPFRDVFLHGLVRDEHGAKMSKSKGNGIDPLDWVERFGADALRFTLARGAQPGGDISVGEDAAQAARNFATKLFNATRFALLNGATIGELPPRDQLTDADRWILDRLESVRAEVDNAWDAYEFGKASEALFHYTWDEVCDWYLEFAKVQFREGNAQNTRIVLGTVLDALLRLLHPTMPFVTEVLWRSLTGGESVMIAAWPTDSGIAADPTAATHVADAQRVITEIRRFRSDQGLGPGQKVPADIEGIDEAGLIEQLQVIRTLARLEEPGDGFAESASLEVPLTAGTITVRIDTSGTVDTAAEIARYSKDLAAAEKELAGTTAKLNNEQFMTKAPQPVRDKIATRRVAAQQEVERLEKRLRQLEAAVGPA